MRASFARVFDRVRQQSEQGRAQERPRRETHEVRQHACAHLFRCAQEQRRSQRAERPTEQGEEEDPEEKRHASGGRLAMKYGLRQEWIAPDEFLFSRRSLARVSSGGSAARLAERRSFEPDEGCHPPGLCVAPVGEESLVIRIAAKSTAMDARDAKTRQLVASQRIQVSLPSAALVADERACVRRIASEELFAHVVAHFECVWLDRRTEPGKERRRIAFKRLYRGRQNAADEAAPARMRGSNPRAALVAEDHRKTIRGEYSAHGARRASNRCVGGRRLIVRTRFDDVRAVNLIQPRWLRDQVQLGAYSTTILRDCRQVVAHVSAEIEARVGPGTHAAVACRDRGANAFGSGPVRDDEVHRCDSIVRRVGMNSNGAAYFAG